jgi:hypothetical protein
MSPGGSMQAEPRVQLIFSKFFSHLIIALPVMALACWLRVQPSRWPGPERTLIGQAEPVRMRSGMRGWRLSAPDRRFGGLSALAIDGGALVALTDSGVVVRFTPPQGASEQLRITLHDLPAGPGSAMRKAARDSESLARDPAGRGWWVGFENRHSLWLYDDRFRSVRQSRRLNVPWSVNRGAEALVVENQQVMALPENGGRAAGGDLVAPAGTSDATRLPDGRLVLLVRRMSIRGFESELRISAGAGHAARRIALDLKPLDNMEGIAAASLPDGGTRLWIVSDDNFRPWMRTLLVALDLPPGA